MGSVTAAASTGSSMALFLKASTAMASLRVEALSLLRMVRRGWTMGGWAASRRGDALQP